MKSKDEQEKILIPSADIILALLNNELRNDLEFLEFYDGYIHAAATEAVFAVDGNKAGYFVNEDMVQEIRIEFLKSLPLLRKRLMQVIHCNKFCEFPIIIKEITKK